MLIVKMEKMQMLTAQVEGKKGVAHLENGKDRRGWYLPLTASKRSFAFLSGTVYRFQRASVHSKLTLNEDTGRVELKLSVPQVMTLLTVTDTGADSFSAAGLLPVQQGMIMSLASLLRVRLLSLLLVQSVFL